MSISIQLAIYPSSHTSLICLMMKSHWQWLRLRPRLRLMSLGSMELCVGVHTAQRQIITHNPIGFCILVIGLGLGLCLGHCQSDYTISIHLMAIYLVSDVPNPPPPERHQIWLDINSNQKTFLGISPHPPKWDISRFGLIQIQTETFLSWLKKTLQNDTKYKLVR